MLFGCSSVQVFVACTDPGFIQFALASCYAVHINALHCQYNESVHRKEEHASSINNIHKKISTLETLKSETFANNVFMKFGSLLSLTCRHRSVQLWNSTMN